MKKILLLLLVLVLSGCSSKKQYIEKTIGISLKNCSIKEEKDTHGGFLGDGEYFAKLECSNIELDSFKKLPLSNKLEEVMNMKFCESKNCENSFEKYKIPKLESGYYYFADRHSDTKDIHDDSNLNNRSSYNFSLAIYDSKTKIMYYYELDT